MTPALTETVTQESGVHLPATIGIRGLSADVKGCGDTSKSNSKANSSSVVYAGTDLCLQKDFPSLKQAESLSSEHYKTVLLLTSTSDLNLQSKSNAACKTEQGPLNQRRHTNPMLVEGKVKRELFPSTTSKVLADVNKLWDITVTKAGGRLDSPVPTYRLHGRVEGRSLAIPFPYNCSSPNLLDLEDEPQNTTSKESEAEVVFTRCLNQQKMLHYRANRNIKRLKSILAKHAVEHCSNEIRGFVSHQFKKQKVKGNSPCQLSKRTEACLEVPAQEGMGSGTCMDLKRTKSPVIRTFCVPTARFMRRIAQELDSDATDSSSAEDCDESTNTNRNAEWNWLSVRAHVGSRWAWLQTQISELEYKIQDLINLHSHIRRKKGSLLFEEPLDTNLKHLPDEDNLIKPADEPEERNLPPSKDLEMSPCSPTLLLRNIEKQSAQVTEMVSSLITDIPISLSMTQPNRPFTRGKMAAGIPHGTAKLQKAGAMSMNGFCKPQSVRRKKRVHVKACSAAGRSAARTRPLQLFYKRTLYRLGSSYIPINVALHSSKTAYCCNESQQTANFSSTWTTSDKWHNVCQIDPHFHHELSLPCDLPLYLHHEALLKSKGESLCRTLSRPEVDMHPSPVTAQWRKECTSSFRDLSCPETQKRESDTETGTSPVTVNVFSDSTHTEDPSQTPCSRESSVQSQTRDPSIVSVSRRRLRSETSYDIDNIVIPMNLVAPIKLEKLQYKEIITPSWKEVIYEPLEMTHNEELEDLSDEAYLGRHHEYEQKEKIRWSFWEQNKWPKKSRYSSHSLGVWAGHVSLPSEASCSPGALSLISMDTVSPNSSASQNPTSVDEFQQEQQIEYWQRRVFPLPEEPPVTSPDTERATNPGPQPQIRGEQRFPSSNNR